MGLGLPFLSVGIILGCIMFFNVFHVIIPNGKNITSAALNNTTLDLNLSKQAKTRSVHNNSMTLLVLFVMLSGHASFVWVSKYNWINISFISNYFLDLFDIILIGRTKKEKQLNSFDNFQISVS